MKFSVKVKAIAGPIANIANVCSPYNSSNPDDLTQYIKFDVTKDHIELIGTDNRVQLSAKIPLNAENNGKSDAETMFLFAAAKARDFFSSLDPEDEVSFEIEDKDTVIKIISSISEFSFRIRRFGIHEEFPVFRMSEDEQSQSLVVEERVLKFMIERSIFCVATNSFKEYLKGVRFEANGDDFSVLGIDGHRLAVMDTKLKEPVKEPIAHSMTLRGVNELTKLLGSAPGQNVELKFNNNYVMVDIGNYHYSSTLVKCNYPDVRGVLPKALEHDIAVDTALFKKSVGRVAICSSRRLNCINLNFKENRLRLFAENTDHESAVAFLNVEYPSADPIEINLNSDFLKSFINAIDTPQVFLGFTKPYSTTLFKPKNANNSEYNELGVKMRYLVSHIIV